MFERHTREMDEEFEALSETFEPLTEDQYLERVHVKCLREWGYSDSELTFHEWLGEKLARLKDLKRRAYAGEQLTKQEAEDIATRVILRRGIIILFHDDLEIWRGGETWKTPARALQLLQSLARPRVATDEQAAFVCSITGLAIDPAGRVVGCDPCCAPAWLLAALNEAQGFEVRERKAQNRDLPIIRKTPTPAPSGKRQRGEMIRKEPVEKLWGKPPSDAQLEAYFTPKTPRTIVEWRVGDLIWQIEHDFEISATRAAIVVRNAITRAILELVGSDQRYLFSLLKREDEFKDLPRWMRGGDWYEDFSVTLNWPW